MEHMWWSRAIVVFVVCAVVAACGGPPASTAPPAVDTTATRPFVAAPTSRPVETIQPPPEPTSPAEGAKVPTLASESQAIIVDNTDPGFSLEAGEWGHCFDGDCGGTCWGQDFQYAEPACTACRARFRFTVEQAGEYDVWTWWPYGEDRATDTRFTLEYRGGPLVVEVDQRNSGDGWFWLASVQYAAGESASIVVQGTSTGYANADATAVTPAGSGPPGERAVAVVPPGDKEPVIQYFYSEASNTPGCYYLHWDVSGAATVWLDGDTVENPASVEVCPEESRLYVLRAESRSGVAEQTLTIEVVAAAPGEAATEELELPTATPVVRPTAAPTPSASGYRRIIFLHHSCGANLIEQGGVRARFAALGYEFYDHGYNGDGLVLADGTWTGENWDVPDDNTDPDGYANIFAQPLHSPPDNTFSHLMEYDVVIFKSCFPVSNIGSDEQLNQYKSYYRSIRARMDQYPAKLFIVVTQPPQVPANTDPQEAARARAFTDWLASQEFLGGRRNVFTFNFFNLLADPATDTLRDEYQGDPYDAHPNERANQAIAPQFVEFVHQAIRTYLAR